MSAQQAARIQNWTIACSASLTLVGAALLLVQQHRLQDRIWKLSSGSGKVEAPWRVIDSRKAKDQAARQQAAAGSVGLVLPVYVLYLKALAVAALIVTVLTWVLMFVDLNVAGEIGVRTTLHVGSICALVMISALLADRSLCNRAFRHALYAASVAVLIAILIDAVAIAAARDSFASVAAAEGSLNALVVLYHLRLAFSATRIASVLPLVVLATATFGPRAFVAFIAAATAEEDAAGNVTGVPQWCFWVDNIAHSLFHCVFPYCIFYCLRVDTLYWRGVGQSAAVNRGIVLDDQSIAALQPLLGGASTVRWLAKSAHGDKGAKVLAAASGPIPERARTGESADSRTTAETDEEALASGDRFSRGTSARLTYTHGNCKWIDFAQVRFGKQIGVGTGARVYEGAFEGQRVAIKVVTPAELDLDTVELFVSEALWTASLRGANVVGLRGLMLRPPDLCLVLELCERGSLAEVLRRRAAAAAAVAEEESSAASRAGGVSDAASVASAKSSHTRRGAGAGGGPGMLSRLFGHASARAASQPLLGDRGSRLSTGLDAMLAAPDAEQEGREWTWNRVLDLAAQAADAVASLHVCDPPVLHRDVKSSNFLVTREWVVKLADFGLARARVDGELVDAEGHGVPSGDDKDGRPTTRKVALSRLSSRGSMLSMLSAGDDASAGSGGRVRVDSFTRAASLSARDRDRDRTRDGAMMTGLLGSACWMAPELVTDREGDRVSYNEAIDVYSLGVTLWEILCGEEPYAGLPAAVILGRLLREDIRPTIPAWCPADYAAVVRSAWSRNPARRPSATNIVLQLRACARGDWRVPPFGAPPPHVATVGGAGYGGGAGSGRAYESGGFTIGGGSASPSSMGERATSPVADSAPPSRGPPGSPLRAAPVSPSRLRPLPP